MAAGIIDNLELIEIEKDQRASRMRLAPKWHQFLREVLNQGSAIWQTRQFVVRGLPHQLVGDPPPLPENCSDAPYRETSQ